MADSPLDPVGLFGERIPPSKQGLGPLLRRWTIPPFTILNAQSGAWQERKRAWLALGIQSELGRGNALIRSGKTSIYRGGAEWASDPWSNTKKATAKVLNPGRGGVWDSDKYNESPTGHGKKVSSAKAINLSLSDEGKTISHGTSVFDPVLCELMYRWFCPPRGRILDPFAGGSVRGVVAGVLGYRYLGLDLSEPQIDANNAQGDEILSPEARSQVTWYAGDSADLDPPSGGPEYDFIFSCPPYGDLEVYSDNPKDISTMPYHEFRATLAQIIGNALAYLKPNRFACFVVGDLRDQGGFLRGFPAHVVEAFERHGARLYNTAYLMASLTTLPLRTSHTFPRSRKMGKVHQDVLVFVKGDPKVACEGLDKGDEE